VLAARTWVFLCTCRNKSGTIAIAGPSLRLTQDCLDIRDYQILSRKILVNFIEC